MNTAAESRTRAIVVEEILPHAAETVWRILTTKELIARWLMANDFTPGLGQKFSMTDKPMGDWDGTVACEITAFEPPTLLRYTWVGGSTNPQAETALESTVTWSLTPVAGGTRVRMVHDGFESPRNDFGYEAMKGGWATVLERIGALARDLD